MGSSAAPVVLYDGECPLCAGAVRFVLPRDRAGRFRFARQGSPDGARLLAAYGHPAGRALVLVEGSRAFTRSDAVLRIAAALGPGWRAAAAIARAVPRRWRDRAYDLVARHRARLPAATSCAPIPAPWRSRWLDHG